MEASAKTETYEPSLLARAVVYLGDHYCTVDLRTLGVFRIAFGVLLLRHLIDTTWGYNGVRFYTEIGMLPASGVLKANIHAPEWGLMFGVTTPGQLRVAFFAMAAVYLAYTLGWHTRVMQILVILILVSLGHRNVLLQNGGVVAVNIAAVFSAFLPLGARFSLDALRRPVPEPGTTIVRFAYGFLTMEFVMIHLLNALAKVGANWRNGSAVHDTMWLNRFASPMAGLLRMHEPSWFSPLMTNGTLIVEHAIPLLILLPVYQRLARRVAILLAFGLHFSISRLMILGPFSYCMMCLAILLVMPDEWKGAETLLPARWRAAIDRLVPKLEAIFGPRRALERTLQQERVAMGLAVVRELSAGFIATACLVQVCRENPILPQRLHVEHRPAVFSLIVDNLQIFQMWHMFAPQAFRHDGTIIVDGVLEDGTHIDPFTGEAPDFEQAFHGPLNYGQPWCDFFWHLGGVEFNKLYRPLFRDYLFRAHTVPGAIVTRPLKQFEAYWVSYNVPHMGSTRPTNLKRTLLVSSDATPVPAPSVGPAQPSPPPPPSQSAEPSEPSEPSPPSRP
jgi:Vitamin K-dependent gamma-carboxylase